MGDDPSEKPAEDSGTAPVSGFLSPGDILPAHHWGQVRREAPEILERASI